MALFTLFYSFNTGIWVKHRLLPRSYFCCITQAPISLGSSIEVHVVEFLEFNLQRFKEGIIALFLRTIVIVVIRMRISRIREEPYFSK